MECDDKKQWRQSARSIVDFLEIYRQLAMEQGNTWAFTRVDRLQSEAISILKASYSPDISRPPASLCFACWQASQSASGGSAGGGNYTGAMCFPDSYHRNQG